MRSNTVQDLDSNGGKGIQCNVVVRIKPKSSENVIWKTSPTTAGETSESFIELAADFAAQKKKENTRFWFDSVLSGSNNRVLYESGARNAVDGCMNGINALIFAYGQTASGKTYSMTGTNNQPGIIPQAVDHVFNYIRQTDDPNIQYLLRVSHLEIYNESIKDLLNPKQRDLRILETPKRGATVNLLCEEIVTSATQVLKILEFGERNRHVEDNYVNKDYRENVGKRKNHYYIPITGSERSDPAGNTGRRLEGSYINRSLLTLTNIISKLVEPSENVLHLPFRDSKLTRLLQPALSGKSRICVIATISPEFLNYEESLNTLKFASRAKQIITRPLVKTEMDDKATIQRYKNELEKLKSQLEEMGGSSRKESVVSPDADKDRILDYYKKLEESTAATKILKDRINHLNRMILTSTSVIEMPLFEWSILKNQEKTSPLMGLPAFFMKNVSHPEFFTSSSSRAKEPRNMTDIEQDDRKIRVLASFIKTLKKVNKDEMAQMVQDFHLDSFMSSRMTIPDLKTEAAIKKINILKEEMDIVMMQKAAVEAEKVQLEVCAQDSAHQISELKLAHDNHVQEISKDIEIQLAQHNKRVQEKEEQARFSDMEAKELHKVADEQLEMIQRLNATLEQTQKSLQAIQKDAEVEERQSEELQDQLDATQTEFKRCLDLESEQLGLIKELQLKLSKSHDEIRSKTGECVVLEKELKVLQLKVSSKTAECANLINELSASKNEARTKASEIMELGKEMDQLRKEFSLSLDSEAELQMTLHELRGNYNELDARFALHREVEAKRFPVVGDQLVLDLERLKSTKMTEKSKEELDEFIEFIKTSRNKDVTYL